MSKDQPPSTTAGSWTDRLALRLFDGVIVRPQTPDDVLNMLREAGQNRVLERDALGMLEGVLSVGGTQVRDIMIPRAQITALEIDTPFTDLVQAVIRSGHSRFPVVAENRDDVIGILLAKDLLRTFAEQKNDDDLTQIDVRSLLREPVFVPESKRVNVLLREFRATRNHMALVADEYGGIAGLVTIEDVLEQIVGDIDDEHDVQEAPNIYQREPKQFSVKALTPIEEFNAYFEKNLQLAEVDTIGGLILRKFGYMPKHGESLGLDGLRFTVIRADRRRLYILQVDVL